ncbi:MAG TPA: hypothetical protein VES89_00085, partial [Candidatus Competibacteraceae bacterium]|nr:hypothetical protein [Candidatus Competibacteraceae bacterium]
VPLEQALEMFAHIPDASLWVLPYATHVTATNTWRADCFALEIIRFLQRRAGQTPRKLQFRTPRG